jgi:hypothetical protein
MATWGWGWEGGGLQRDEGEIPEMTDAFINLMW